MKILVYSTHRYTGPRTEGSGQATCAMPSGAPFKILDLLVRGLAELGHTVHYALDGGFATSPPPGVVAVSPDDPPRDVDIVHNCKSASRPWVYTAHRHFPEVPRAPANWIFVSRTLAQLHGSDTYVVNGLDPDELSYREIKGDYLLFLSALEGPRYPRQWYDKGLDRAIEIARASGMRLIVAGTAIREVVLDEVERMCREGGAEFVGDVRGPAKAELLANARALVFPTRLPEGCALVILEALLSGTPVICSDSGPTHELVDDDSGFVCSGLDDYLDAIASLSRISPRRCHERALERFHYRRMASDYVREYERRIARPRPDLRADPHDDRSWVPHASGGRPGGCP